MLKRLRKWFLRNLLYIFVLSQFVNSASVQFYKFRNSSGLVYNSSSTAKCINVPENKGNVFVYSIQTDVCIMVYAYPNCQSWSRKFDHDNTLDWQWHVKSYHICNDNIGGNKLNIDITKFYDLFNTPSDNPKVLQSYHNVCDCVNVPKYVQEMPKWSLNNHGNNLIAYYESDCTKLIWEPMVIPAGHLSETMYMANHQMRNNLTKTVYKIQSLGPDPNSTYFKTSCKHSYNYNWIMPLESFETDQDLDAMQQFGSQDMIDLPKSDNRIIFFENTDFQGTYYESKLTDHCQSVPRNTALDLQTEVQSVTTDLCVMLFTDNQCLSRSIKIYPSGSANLTRNWEFTVTSDQTLDLLYNMFPNWKWVTGSFQTCTEEDGSPQQLTVDLTSYYSADKEPKANQPAATIYSRYINLCTCQNIPNEVQIIDKYSIENHGNSLMAYFEKNCLVTTFDPLWIPAGRSSYSIGLGSFTKTYNKTTPIVQKILSIGPDPNAEYYQNNCAKYADANSNMNIIRGNMNTQLPMENVDNVNIVMGLGGQPYPISNQNSSQNMANTRKKAYQSTGSINGNKIVVQQSNNNKVPVQYTKISNQMLVEMSIKNNQGFTNSSKLHTRIIRQLSDTDFPVSQQFLPNDNQILLKQSNIASTIPIQTQLGIDGPMSPAFANDQLPMQPPNNGDQMQQRFTRDGNMNEPPISGNQTQKRSARNGTVSAPAVRGNQMLTPSNNAIRILIQQPTNQMQPSVLGNPMMTKPYFGNQMTQPMNNPYQMTQPLNNPYEMTQPMNYPNQMTQPMNYPNHMTQPMSNPNQMYGNSPPINENVSPEVAMKGQTQPFPTGNGNQPRTETPPIKENAPPEIDIDSPTNEGITHTHNQVLAQPSLQDKQEILNPMNNQKSAQPSQNSYQGLRQPYNGNQAMAQPNNNQMLTQRNNGNQMMMGPNNNQNMMQPKIGNPMVLQSQASNVSIKLSAQPSNMGIQMSVQPQQMSNQMPMQTSNMPNQMAMQPTYMGNQISTQPMNNPNQLNEDTPPIYENAPPEVAEKGETKPMAKGNGNQPRTESPPIKENAPPEIDIDSPANEGITHTHNQLLAQPSLQDKQEILNPINNNKKKSAQPSQYGNQILNQPYNVNQALNQPYNVNQVPNQPYNSNQMSPSSSNQIGNTDTSDNNYNILGQPYYNGNHMPLQTNNTPKKKYTEPGGVPNKINEQSSQPSNLGIQIPGQPSNTLVPMSQGPPNSNATPMQSSHLQNQMLMQSTQSPNLMPKQQPNMVNHTTTQRPNSLDPLVLHSGTNTVNMSTEPTIMRSQSPGQPSTMLRQMPMKPSTMSTQMPMQPLPMSGQMPVQQPPQSSNVRINVSPNSNTGIQMSVQPSNIGNSMGPNPSNMGKQMPTHRSDLNNQTPVPPSGEGSLLMPKNKENQISSQPSTMGIQMPMQSTNDGKQMVVEVSIKGGKGLNNSGSPRDGRHIYHQKPKQPFKLTDRMRMQSAKLKNQTKMQPLATGNQMPVQNSNKNQIPVQSSNINVNITSQSSNPGIQMSVQPSSMGNQMPKQQSNKVNQMSMAWSDMGNETPMAPSTFGNQMPMQPSGMGNPMSTAPSNMGNQMPMQSSNMGNQMQMQPFSTNPVPTQSSNINVNVSSLPSGIQMSIQPSNTGNKMPMQPSNMPNQMPMQPSSMGNQMPLQPYYMPNQMPNQMLTQPAQNGNKMLDQTSLQNKQQIMNPTNSNNQMSGNIGQPMQNG